MLTDQEILDVAEPFGAFEFGDAQGDKRKDFARAVIEANNAKVLADLKYVGFLHEEGCFLKVTPSDNPVYTGKQVSALIQRNEALEARVKELERLHRLYAAN
ncbi:hypothetical protein OEZ78_26090 [Leclercia adecarboxylata]|uniref:hypothetical protein n=1 Tax=Leclercia adecarboxylata TaxID=83655 RepID=UPI00234C197F|nr:hypothetical protein [Leclercia adecarboxylata]MDC6678938.1 hypothetical protein [Leclercia adecarboxylata]